MEVYAAVFNTDLQTVRATQAIIIDADSFPNERTSHACLFFGNGAMKCKEILSSANAEFITDFKCSAEYQAIPAEAAFKSNRLEDVAYFEPFYLKDFMVKKKG
jgi:tRNA threonylcarbamoyladenosine biosynthesis protein TsaB